MQNFNFNQHITQLLKTDNRLVDDENDLQINVLRDLVNNLDSQLIELLIADDKVREKFFIKVKDVYVFKQNDFIFYLDSKVLDGSYTQYANRIGLASGGKFLTDSTDYVLDFPYKDCVLEGGQSTEEGNDVYFEYDADADDYIEKTAKRKEIFYNNIIAKDEIDRLLEPKAFQKVVRYDANGETIPTSFTRDAELNRQRGLPEDTITDNLIIKGNNLLALHSIEKEFKGKVKLIYIDPPYNTGGSGDTFIYNNNFKRSTWMTFMKNRLEVAYSLLKDDGVLIAAIDDYEVHSLKFILDNLFGADNRLGTVVVVHNPRGRNDDKYFATMHEYMLIYAKNKDLVKLKNFEFTNEDLKQFNKEDEISKYAETPFTRTGNNSSRHERPKLFYSIYYNPTTDSLSLINDNNSIELLPINPTGEEKTWRWGKETFELKKNTELFVKKVKGEFKIFKKRRPDDIAGRKPRTVWSDSKYDASSNGIMLLRNLLGKNDFSYPKSLYAVLDIIKILSEKDDVILDFFGGSGTTAHAVLDLNKQELAIRQFIIVEQMHYAETVIVERCKKLLGNYDFSFVYAELAKNNETAKERIDACNSLEELVQLFEELNTRYFLDYNVRIKDFKENIVKEEAFINLSLARQKELFKRMLDNNQLYVNLSEVEDARYNLSEDAIRLTKDFYQIKN